VIARKQPNIRKPFDSTGEFKYKLCMFFKQKKPYRLLTPGPVPLHPAVEKILGEPMIHHRTPEFEKTLKSVVDKLKIAFSTSQNVYMHTSSGSGAMESAIVNTLSPGDEVLCIVSGKFGERWAEMCKVFGMKVQTLNVAWGDAVKVEDVRTALTQNRNIKAVLTQACETSTATVHPIKEIAALTKSLENTLLIVDAITAVGAMPLEMDAWGIDVVIGGSQKAFMLPAGLSFIALSEKAWRANANSKCPKFYFDLALEKKSLAKGETHFSSAVPLIRALDVALDHLTGQNKIKTLERIQSLAKATREATAHLGFEVYSKSPSASVTALKVPAGIDSQKLREHIEKEYNMTLMGGQDQLKGKILRVGHLGYITNDDMTALIEILYAALNDFKLPGLTKEKLDSAKTTLKKYLT
jgi:aspartate aminotransferase-like enzyme